MATAELARGNLVAPIARGEVRNPNGSRIRRSAEQLAQHAQAYGIELIDALRDIVHDGHASAMARVRAAEVILDRGYGKAADSLALQLAEEASAASVELSVTFRMGDRRPAGADAARPLELGSASD